MKIETQPRDDHQITLTVELEPEKLESARHRAARKIAEKAKIAGFRPGKAPFEIVRRLYGDTVINEEAVEILVDEIYPEALKNANIEPAAPGQLENIESLDPPKFIFTVPLIPTTDLGDYKSVRLPYEFVAPGDEKFDEEIVNLRRMYAKTELSTEPVADSDYLLLDVIGRKTESSEEEEPLVERKSFAIVAHSDENKSEWPFSGFATGLIGMNPDEPREFSHQYSSDFPDEKLAGQNVHFLVTVKTIRTVNLPELDDDFAKMCGIGQTADELRIRMRENIETEALSTYEDEYFEKLVEIIKAGATIKYPPQVLDHEIEHVLEDVQHRLKDQGVENMDAYYKMIDSNKEKFIEEQARPTSIKRLERGLIMDELARVEKIEIDQDELKTEFSNAWATLSMSDENFAKRTKNGTKASREIVDAVAMDSANRLLTRRILARIKEIASSQAPLETLESGQTSLPLDTSPEVIEEPTLPIAPKKRATKKKAE